MMKLAIASCLLFFMAVNGHAQAGSAKLDGVTSNKARYDTTYAQLVGQVESVSQGVGRANCCNGRNEFYDQNNAVCRNATTGAVVGTVASLCASGAVHGAGTSSADTTNKGAIGNTLEYQAQTRKLLQMKQAITVLGMVKNNVSCCSSSQTFYRAPNSCVDPVSGAVSQPSCLKSN